MSYKKYDGNDVVKGYKSFILKENRLFDGYGNEYEIGKTYHQEGKIGYLENGYHFCLDPIDTLAFSNGYDKLIVCEIEGFGNMYSVDNEYKEIFDIHISENFKIIKVIPSDELINIIKKSGYYVIEKYIKFQSNFINDEDIEDIISERLELDKVRLRKSYELTKNFNQEKSLQRIR